MDLREAVEAVARRIADLLEFAPPLEPFRPGELEAQLATHRGGLYLGVLDEETARAALEREGVLPALRARTGAEVRIELRPDDGILRVLRTDRPEPLVEIK